MSWSEIKAANRNLREVGDGPITGAWQEFCQTVQRTADAPPYHLAILLNRIEQYRGARQKSEIAIFDHGCGGGLTLLYLAARGYTNIYATMSAAITACKTVSRRRSCGIPRRASR